MLLAVLLFVAAPAAAAPPRAGTLVPGRTLGGIRLGETAAQVRVALGDRYGVCRGCKTTTWYFTYRPFTREGLGVELTRNRVSAVYTLSQPSGWSAPKGLFIGAIEAQVTTLAGPLVVLTCSGYEAFTKDTTEAQTAYYIVDGKLWGFGLMRAHTNPCR
ncbi:MAG: hypothetical protein ABI990_03150 [Actinomycetota bacterium]